MEYECKTCSVTQLLVTGIGAIEPLCNKCNTLDCTNPVEKREVSIMGVNRTWRMLNRGSEVYMVVECEGFTG